jgi:hypothetical protein
MECEPIRNQAPLAPHPRVYMCSPPQKYFLEFSHGVCDTLNTQLGRTSYEKDIESGAATETPE